MLLITARYVHSRPDSIKRQRRHSETLTTPPTVSEYPIADGVFSCTGHTNRTLRCVSSSRSLPFVVLLLFRELITFKPAILPMVCCTCCVLETAVGPAAGANDVAAEPASMLVSCVAIDVVAAAVVIDAGDDDDDEDVVVTFGDTQSSSPPASGNLSHCRFSGQSKPKLRNKCSQRRALSHSDRHGGIGSSSIVQTGTYTRQRKNCRSGLQLTLTSGVNWITSKPASSCRVWPSMFGIIVVLYGMFVSQMATVMASHLPFGGCRSAGGVTEDTGGTIASTEPTSGNDGGPQRRKSAKITKTMRRFKRQATEVLPIVPTALKHLLERIIDIVVVVVCVMCDLQCAQPASEIRGGCFE